MNLKDTIISGYSVSSDGDDSDTNASISLNYTSMSQKTKSVFRRPISVPIELSKNFGIHQPHTEFRAIGTEIFTRLSQKDLWNVAQTCILWLHCSSSNLLLKERSHEWSYNLATGETSLDGFRLPSLVSERSGYDSDGDNNNENQDEKEKEKAKKEVEQSIVREDLKKAPFPHFLKINKTASKFSKSTLAKVIISRRSTYVRVFVCNVCFF